MTTQTATELTQSPLHATIHRGAAQVGGSCVELELDGCRIILDAGLDLDASTTAPGEPPDVPGLWAGSSGPPVDALFVSHGHPDHMGRVAQVRADVPIYTGEATARIARAASFYVPSTPVPLASARALQHGIPIVVGPFTVTPVLVDHSAYDSYALVVDGGGRRVVYSGDLRLHGRKPGTLARLAAHGRDPDLLLLEGTTLDRDTVGMTEREVEECVTEVARSDDRLVLAAASPQNVDRIVSLYRAARRSGRELVIDLYAAEVLAATGRASIPQHTWDGVRVFVPSSQRRRVIAHRAFERIDVTRPARIFPTELVANPGRFVMLFRPSMERDLKRFYVLRGAHLVWSMWAGYIDENVEGLLSRHCMTLSDAHASGHASRADLQRIVAALAPRTITPIHTWAPELMRSFGPQVVPLDDGTSWPVGRLGAGVDHEADRVHERRLPRSPGAAASLPRRPGARRAATAAVPRPAPRVRHDDGRPHQHPPRPGMARPQRPAQHDARPALDPAPRRPCTGRARIRSGDRIAVPVATEQKGTWNGSPTSVRLLFQFLARSVSYGTPCTMERLDLPTTPPTERQLIELAGKTLRARLPDGWTATVDTGRRNLSRGDAVLRLQGPDGRAAALVLEAKSLVNARDVPGVTLQLGLGEDPEIAGALVVARYLSPRTRDALQAGGMSYVDATGNVRVSVTEPAVFLLCEGANSDPWRSPDRPTNSLRGAPAARVVRALVDMRPPWRIRELAQAADASLGSTSRTVDFLAREALVDRDDTGAVTGVDWPGLLQRWSADYDIARKRRVVGFVAGRGMKSIEDGLRGWDVTYALSGSLAAATWAPYAESRLAIVYSSEVEQVASRLGLREVPSRPNVLVIEPDADYVFARTSDRDGVRVAAPSQVAVDLLVGPGRNPEEGRALIEWMRANEDQWRQR